MVEDMEISNYQVKIIEEMLSNIENCPKCKCSACKSSISVIMDVIEDARQEEHYIN